MKRHIINQIVQEKLKRHPNYENIRKLQQLLDLEIDGNEDVHEV
jgi:hypothetical protein